MTEPPTGIIRTLPPCYLDPESKEGRVFHQCIERMKGESDEIFGFSLSGKPKHDVIHVYVLCAGGVRWRFNIAEFKDSEHRCLDGVVRRGQWVYCCGPVIEAQYPVAMRGFQGFRYTGPLF